MSDKSFSTGSAPSSANPGDYGGQSDRADLNTQNQESAAKIACRQTNEEVLLLRERQCRALTALLASAADTGQQLLELILRMALQLVGAQNGHIGLYNEERTAFFIQCAIGEGNALIGVPQPIDAGLKGQVFRSGQFAYVTNYQEYPHRIQDTQYSEIASAVAAPLKQGATVKGQLMVHWFDKAHRPRQEDLELLRQYADLASIVILQADNREKIKRRNQLLSALAATTTALIGQLDLGRTLELILDQALHLIGVQHGFIMLFDESESPSLRIRCGKGRYASRVGGIALEQGANAEVLRTNRLVYIADYPSWKERITGPFYDDITALMQSPLTVDGNILGILGIAAFGEPVRIDSETLSALEQFATVASIALKNSLLFRQTLHLALHDSLTGLPNRAHLLQKLPEFLAPSGDAPATGVILYIDLDDLKAINDTFGHAAGDQVIAAAAARIAGYISSQNFVARTGGDEFVVVMPGETAQARIAAVTDSLLKLLSQEYRFQASRIVASASIGVSSYPADGDAPEILLKKADNAMYAAKKAGQNCWRHYDPIFQRDSYKKLAWTHSLRRALDRDEFFVHYQPIIELPIGKTIGFEALLRWQSPEHGLVSPDQFIPLAEESRFILPLGTWVLQQACAFVRRLQTFGWQQLHVAVNISPRQLAAADFFAVVRSCIAGAGIDPRQLQLEITETVLMESVDDVFCKLVELREQGIGLSLDDFGIGYSSLTYLRSLPIGTLKIDKSFINCLARDETQARFVGHIIDMAHTLKLTVVAEGVETAQQWEKLRQLGCDRVQGYLFCRPVAATDALKFIQENG